MDGNGGDVEAAQAADRADGKEVQLMAQKMASDCVDVAWQDQARLTQKQKLCDSAEL